MSDTHPVVVVHFVGLVGLSKIRFTLDGRLHSCGTVREGVQVFMNDETSPGVVDLDALERAIVAIKKVRALTRRSQGSR